MRRSSSVFDFIRSALTFSRKQPILWIATFWLVAVPNTAVELISPGPLEAAPLQEWWQTALLILVILVLFVAAFWGLACQLVIGRRMIQAKAGRVRTSFRAVRKDAQKLIAPLLLTSVLRGCIAVEWAVLFAVPFVLALLSPTMCPAPSIDQANALMTLPSRCPAALLFLPLLLPAAYYLLRTIFYGIVMATEPLRYRAALRRSSVMFHGRRWQTLGTVLLLMLILLLPGYVLASLASTGIEAVSPSAFPLAIIVGNLITAAVELLFLLSLIALYGTLKRGRGTKVEPPI